MTQNQVHIKASDRAIVVGVGLKTEPLSEIKENLLELEELVGRPGGIIGRHRQHLHFLGCERYDKFALEATADSRQQKNKNARAR